MKSTIKDVAKLAGVSISTVSRVMNAPDAVIETKRKRVLEAVEQLNYQPNALARGLIYKKTDTLGVLIPDIENPYYAGVIRGMQDAATGLGYTLLISNTDRNKNRIINYFQSFYEKQVDGILFASDTFFEEYYQEMKRFQFPLVLASTHSQFDDVPSVEIDDEAAAYDAVSYLISQGHRRIGMISFPFGDTISGQPRYDGFIRALTEQGLLENNDNVQFANHWFEDAYESTGKLFKKNPDITAVFAASDEFAMGVISYLYEHGIRVPEQVSVVGFDDIRMAHMMIPKLTTVAQPAYQIGFRSVEKLNEIISSGKSEVIREVLNHKLMIRNSVKSK
jgi:LacI family transcriptional regulator